MGATQWQYTLAVYMKVYAGHVKATGGHQRTVGVQTTRHLSAAFQTKHINMNTNQQSNLTMARVNHQEGTTLRAASLRTLSINQDRVHGYHLKTYTNTVKGSNKGQDCLHPQLIYQHNISNQMIRIHMSSHQYQQSI